MTHTAAARLRAATLLPAIAAVLVVALLGAAPAGAASYGGAEFADTPAAAAAAAPAAPRRRATVAPDGLTALAPAGAPPAVQAAIAAANRIVGRPYRWGGGHGRFEDAGYDCSGTVSYALRNAGLLAGALPSGPLMAWGNRGRGRWITVYANRGHAYAVIAGLRLDTSGPGARGPRWRPASRSSRGFAARHPRGL